jgi:nucleotide-binding universal stress UspA family protein
MLRQVHMALLIERIAMKISSLLAATDFSPAADLAIERAALLARHYASTLHLLHVVPPISWRMFGAAFSEHPLAMEERMHDAAKTRLIEMAQAAEQRYAMTVRSHVEIGDVPERIGEYVRAHAIDLTVLGRRTGQLGRDFFLGSTSLKYLHLMTEPTLIVQTPASAHYQIGLVAIDFSDVSKPMIETAQQVAPHATLYAMHVFDVEFESMMRYAGVEDDVVQQYRNAAETEAAYRMEACLRSVNQSRSVLPIVRNGPPAKLLLDEADALQAGVIVVGKRLKSGLEKWMLGSVTEDVAFLCQGRDLLVVANGNAFLNN